MADLIRKHGGAPLAARPSARSPLDDNPEVFDFADHLIAGDFDVVIFETGVGVRYLTQAIETRIPRDAWLAALSRDKGRRPWSQTGGGAAGIEGSDRSSGSRAQHLA